VKRDAEEDGGNAVAALAALGRSEIKARNVFNLTVCGILIRHLFCAIRESE
jgi:hypothetical protein